MILPNSFGFRSSREEMPVQSEQLPTIDNTFNILSGNCGLGDLGNSMDGEKSAAATDDLIESLVCPPPPSSDFSQLILSDTQLSKFIVPKVDDFFSSNNIESIDQFETENLGLTTALFNEINDDILKDYVQPTIDDQLEAQLCKEDSVEKSTDTFSTVMSSTTSRASIVHLEKLIRELLSTEETYCQSLKQLVKLYLEPLSQNNFLTQTDVKVLFGSIMSIIEAQNEFRSELNEVGEHILGDCQMLLSRDEEPNINELGIGFIADCFLKHCANFRNYSVRLIGENI